MFVDNTVLVKRLLDLHAEPLKCHAVWYLALALLLPTPNPRML